MRELERQRRQRPVGRLGGTDRVADDDREGARELDPRHVAPDGLLVAGFSVVVVVFFTVVVVFLTVVGGSIGLSLGPLYPQRSTWATYGVGSTAFPPFGCTSKCTCGTNVSPVEPT